VRQASMQPVVDREITTQSSSSLLGEKFYAILSPNHMNKPRCLCAAH
jgi:hypothetical protein